MIDLKTKVREVPDFPEPGVGFKDISPLLLDREALAQAVEELAAWARERDADLILGAEARGFWLGGAIAVAAGCRFTSAFTFFNVRGPSTSESAVTVPSRLGQTGDDAGRRRLMRSESTVPFWRAPRIAVCTVAASRSPNAA